MKKVQTHFKYGGLTGLLMVIISLVMYIVGTDPKSKLGLIGIVPFIVGIIMNAMAYSKANAQEVTFGEVFSSCFKATALIALIIFAWSVISVMIFPAMKEKGMEIALEEMSKNPQMDDEMIDKWMGKMDKYYGLFTGLWMVMAVIFWGAVLSLIGAAIAKKKPKGMPKAE